MVENDCPGPNKDKNKGKDMRSFVIPYAEEGTSSANKTATINIFAAFVTENSAVIITDGARIARLHVTSIGRFWKAKDLKAGSKVSCYFTSYILFIHSTIHI